MGFYCHYFFIITIWDIVQFGKQSEMQHCNAGCVTMEVSNDDPWEQGVVFLTEFMKNPWMSITPFSVAKPFIC